MRKMNYLSPTSISLFYTDPREFYLQYLCEERPERPPQTLPMACGSAFDAYVKSYIHEKILGSDPKFELRTLFEAQVETQHRDYTWILGKYLFMMYQKSGALSDLMLDLGQSIGSPRFEIEIKGVVKGSRESVVNIVQDLILLGKPDVFYINKYGLHVILDWKVNGAMGKYNVSPMRGYVRIRDPLGKGSGQHHKECVMINHSGVVINGKEYLEQLEPSWASQLSIYAWLLGVEVGADFIASIDQIACDGSCRFKWGGIEVPDIRIAEHREQVSSDFQHMVLEKARHVWEVVHSDYIFRDMTLEDSKEYCQRLDMLMARKPQNENDQLLKDWSRGR